MKADGEPFPSTALEDQGKFQMQDSKHEGTQEVHPDKSRFLALFKEETFLTLVEYCFDFYEYSCCYHCSSYYHYYHYYHHQLLPLPLLKNFLQGRIVAV